MVCVWWCVYVCVCMCVCGVCVVYGVCVVVVCVCVCVCVPESFLRHAPLPALKLMRHLSGSSCSISCCESTESNALYLHRHVSSLIEILSLQVRL
jgi:hypothetical protein